MFINLFQSSLEVLMQSMHYGLRFLAGIWHGSNADVAQSSAIYHRCCWYDPLGDIRMLFFSTLSRSIVDQTDNSRKSPLSESATTGNERVLNFNRLENVASLFRIIDDDNNASPDEYGYPSCFQRFSSLHEKLI